jgi:DNA-binding Lrp family transcriptional regulator
MIELAKHDRALVEGFLEEALRIPEVVAVYLVTGRYDVLVHAALRDTDHMRDLAFDAFTKRQEVVKIETSLVFSHARKPAWPAPGEIGNPD